MEKKSQPGLLAAVRIEGDRIEAVEERIKTAAKIQKVHYKKYLDVLLGENTYLYYHSFSVKGLLSLALPGDVLYPNIMKVWVMIESSSWEKNNNIKEYLLSLLYERNARGFGYNYLCVMDPSLTCEKIHLIFMGVEPLSKIRDSSEFEKLIFEPERQEVKKELLMPKQICAELDKTVLGQEEAKKSLSVVLYQHLKRYALSREGKSLPKTNALLIGPTGCGKTLLAKALAEIAGVPFLKVDATNFTQRGYRGGMHAEQLVDLLRSAAKGRMDQASWAIVFVDEIDKLSHAMGEDDACAGSGVQQDLLAVVDGGKMFYEPDHTEYGREAFDFSNVLFIFAGAFSRLQDKENISSQDLVRYGLIPEFANRLGGIIRLEPFSDDLVKHMVKREIEAYGNYLSLSREEKNVYVEIIHSTILASKEYEEMGGRCVGPKVRSFFEDRIFEQEAKSDGKEKD